MSEARFIPYGEEGELTAVRGWRSRPFMLTGVRRLMDDTLSVDEMVEAWPDVLSAGVIRGWARFWKRDDRTCPWGSDGGVKLSRTWQWGYVPATWIWTH